MMEIDDYDNIHKKLDLSIKTDINFLKSKLKQFSKLAKDEVFTRTANSEYVNDSILFIQDLAPTYNQFYLNQNVRANIMRQKLEENAKIRWPNISLCDKIREIQGKVNKRTNH